MFDIADLPERMRTKVQVDESGCWRWQGYCMKNGYGTTRVNGRSWLVHRRSYTLLVGDIPDGMQIDHLCRTRDCLNPAHLEPVTPRTNLRRGETVLAANLRKTHCPKGHPYEGDNLVIEVSRTGVKKRKCRICKNARLRERGKEYTYRWRDKNREKYRQYMRDYHRKRREAAIDA